MSSLIGDKIYIAAKEIFTIMDESNMIEEAVRKPERFVPVGGQFLKE